MKTTTQETFVADSRMARRSFLKYAGAGAVAAGVLATAASCQKHGGVVSDPQVVDLGTGDIAVLNYAYALEQLEAAFYKRVIDSKYSGMNADETALLTDIRDHEVIHAAFFKAALGGNAIPDLTANFATINFNDRTAVLTAAKTFEDLGVAAYNGAGALIQTTEYLVLAGKIVSVEARHAALIRNLLNQNLADESILDLSTGLEKHKAPSQVLPIANSFITGKPLSAPALGA
ncbi:ferritin-like domain-containing protein [Mucilaginibacter sp. PAMB04168]|uniref:ferritin-like domain-containing protein n=1 Tax=Mucilaginibacter sp. PAMB04168 TaxID=3138567 RepID=UPI0031F6B267